MIVIGAGRIGTALKLRAEHWGLPLRLLDRTSGGESLDEEAGEPIFLAVRNDDLEGIVGKVPVHRRDDLVFPQNGALRELLHRLGLQRPTRGILYTMVARRGDEGTAGADSPFTGPRAEEVVRVLRTLQLPAEVVDADTFADFELEKLLWLSILGPLCEETGQTVGGVVQSHRDELSALVSELAAVGRAAWGVQASPSALTARIVAYSESIAPYRASVKEWPWRNGWLVANARAHAVPTPLHDALLTRLGYPK